MAAEVLGSGGDIDRVRLRVLQILSGQGAAVWDRLAAISGEDVNQKEPSADASALLTSSDVDEVLRDALVVGAPRAGQHSAGGVQYRTSEFLARTPLHVRLSVAAADVTLDAFDRFTGARNPTSAVPVEGVGDRATFDKQTGAVRVLSGSTVFIVSVAGHDDPLPLASALARKVIDRMNPSLPAA